MKRIKVLVVDDSAVVRMKYRKGRLFPLYSEPVPDTGHDTIFAIPAASPLACQQFIKGKRVEAGQDALKPGNDMPTKKIMVVDDSRTLREAAATELRTAGYEVSEAAHGREALEMLNAERFDLVICDVLMPVMDGIAFVKEARKRPDCRFLPIVMLTTEAGERRRQEGQMAGATAWVVKPFRPEQILHVVSKLVTR